MRRMDPMTSLEMAELAVANRGRGVVGFDLAGDETAASMGGKLTLDQAEILIPEGGGPDVPVLEVVEVHSREAFERQGFRRRDEDGFALDDLPAGVTVAGVARSGDHATAGYVHCPPGPPGPGCERRVSSCRCR